MIFNICYLNFPKVYEIKMMLSNVINLNRKKQTDMADQIEIDYKAKLGVFFLNLNINKNNN